MKIIHKPQPSSRSPRFVAETRQDSEIRFRRLFESAQDGILLIDAGTEKITDANPSFCELAGVTLREILGTTIGDFPPIAKLLKTGDILPLIKTQGFARYNNLQLETKAGRHIPVEFIGNVFPVGEKRMIQCVIRDNTQNEFHESEIQTHNGTDKKRSEMRAAELEDANKELEAFTYSVSHDLRAPLRHIMGFVEILLRDASGELSAPHQHHLATIAAAARRMAVLVEDLLVFSRISRSEMKKSVVSLGLLLKEALNDLREETKGRNIKWIIHELPSVMADPSLMRQVLVNILANAIKFTSKRDQAVIEIGCDTSQPGEKILSIWDNGIGFDSKYSRKIFGVFERLHDGTEYEGTGIGLALVQRLIHRHGGRAWATGEPGNGATFYLSIPSPLPKNEKTNT